MGGLVHALRMDPDLGPPGEAPARGPRVVMLLSQLAGNGGIQRYNRLLCKTVHEYQGQHDLQVDIISLIDPNPMPRDDLQPASSTGCGGNRLRFVAAALHALARPYSLVVVGHVDLAVVALLPHALHRRSSMLILTHGEEVWERLPWYKRGGLLPADQIWAVSEYTKKHIVTRQRVPAERIQVVPNVLDPEFSQRAQANEPNPRIRSRLLAVSRLSRIDGAGKGIDNTIMALPAVRSIVPDVDFTVVGGGDDMPRLEELSRRVGVKDIVTFAGEVQDGDLHDYVRGTDVFVLPSRQEGFGIVFLEAMAYSKPVIAGAHGGTPEVVEDGKTGKLVPFGDHAALVEAIAMLLASAELRNAMGRAGRERVQTVFRFDRFRTPVFELLDRTGGRTRERIG
jgi:phosphatidyl-myo-inositol dimannoside synthase